VPHARYLAYQPQPVPAARRSRRCRPT
jgi:hypothetical protein